MRAKRVTKQAEQLNDDELSFWRGCFRTALDDCLSIKRTPEFCAQIAGEVADASVLELRRRTTPAPVTHTMRRLRS